MKILHIIMSFNTGGAETLLVDLLNNNKNIDQNIIIINNSYDTNLLDRINLSNKIKLINRPESSKNIIYIIKLISFVYKFKPDIIHCHNIASFKLAIILKRVFRNIKIVYTIHDTNIIKENIFLVSKINKYCDKVISISDSVKEECLYYGIDNFKISKVYNGIDIEKFNIVKEKHKNINIGCVARILPEKKGQDILIKALEKIKDKQDIRLFFAGDVEYINGKKILKKLNILKKLVKDLNLNENVEFCGNIENIPEFLKNIDILVLPSRYEGFGLVLIEAMAAKIPVIASNIDGPKKIINDKYGYLFNVNDHEDLALKLLECIDNYDKTIDDAYKYVCKNYSIENMIKEYGKIYEQIL